MNEVVNIFVHVVEDDNDMLFEIKRLFKLKGILHYKTFTDPQVFLKEEAERVEVALLDNRFDGHGITALDITKILMVKNPLTKIIVMTIQPTFEMFHQLHTEGIYKYLGKMQSDFSEELIRWTKAAIEIVTEDRAKKAALNILKKKYDN